MAGEHWLQLAKLAVNQVRSMQHRPTKLTRSSAKFALCTEDGWIQDTRSLNSSQVVPKEQAPHGTMLLSNIVDATRNHLLISPLVIVQRVVARCWCVKHLSC